MRREQGERGRAECSRRTQGLWECWPTATVEISDLQVIWNSQKTDSRKAIHICLRKDSGSWTIGPALSPVFLLYCNIQQVSSTLSWGSVSSSPWPAGLGSRGQGLQPCPQDQAVSGQSCNGPKKEGWSLLPAGLGQMGGQIMPSCSHWLHSKEIELYKPIPLCQPAQTPQKSVKSWLVLLHSGKKLYTRGEKEAKNPEAQCHVLLNNSPMRDSLPMALVMLSSC